MRKLNTADVFGLCRLIKATGAREALSKVVAAAADREDRGEQVDLTTLGVDGFLAILEGAVEPRVEEMTYKLLAGPLECEPQEVAEMPLPELAASLKQISEENDLPRFFGFVSGMIGKD